MCKVERSSKLVHLCVSAPVQGRGSSMLDWVWPIQGGSGRGGGGVLSTYGQGVSNNTEDWFYLQVSTDCELPGFQYAIAKCISSIYAHTV